ncbi:MAG: SIMPL domain-containing protein [Alphaproteobacteria bacterium]|nr:SIMPL domain-containing protein [Alphaproteobacteria bacterium]
MSRASFSISFLFLTASSLAGASGATKAQPVFAVPLKDAVPSITTRGASSAEVVPDLATISLGVETERPKAGDAARDNAAAIQAVVAEIKAQGVEAKDVKTVSITLAPVYDETTDSNGRIKRTRRGYLASNVLSVRVRDVTKAGTLAGQLLDKGVNNVQGISFDYSQKDSKYEGLRVDAVRDAQRKANSYVSGLGIKLGRILLIAPEPREAAPVAMRTLGGAAGDAAMAVPVEPGVETLRMEVEVTWELTQ